MIDQEVSKILNEQYQRAKDVLIAHKEKVEQLGSELLINEVIFKADLETIFGIRKWKSYEEEQLKLDKKKKNKISLLKKKNDKTA